MASFDRRNRHFRAFFSARTGAPDRPWRIRPPVCRWRSGRAPPRRPAASRPPLEVWHLAAALMLGCQQALNFPRSPQVIGRRLHQLIDNAPPRADRRGCVQRLSPDPPSSQDQRQVVLGVGCAVRTARCWADGDVGAAPAHPVGVRSLVRGPFGRAAGLGARFPRLPTALTRPWARSSCAAATVCRVRAVAWRAGRSGVGRRLPRSA